jgi:GAF domain
MYRRYLLFSLVSLIGVAGVVLPFLFYHEATGLPFLTAHSSAGQLAVAPLPGVALPPGLQAGDLFDWQAMTPQARAAVLTAGLMSTVVETTPLIVRRGGAPITVPVSSVPLVGIPGAFTGLIEVTVTTLLLLVLGLFTLWRGRDWVAWGLSLFAFSFMQSTGYVGTIPGTPYVNLILLLAIVGFCMPLGYLGLYVTAETLAGPVLGGRLRGIFRIFLATLLGALVILALGRVLGTVFLGWPVGGWFAADRICGLLLIFLIVGVLLVGYLRFPTASRLRLRWLLASTLVFAVAFIVFGFTPIIQSFLGVFVLYSLLALAYAGYLYGVLRHRLVDLSFIIDRTLVYGATTSLVVGVLAAVNALAQHAALGQNTSLVLQVVVPLALGIVLGTVRKRIDASVERVFFRRKYKADQALRTFAQQCAFIEQETPLLDRAVQELKQHTGAPGVALYERGPSGYRCIRQLGTSAYPKSIATDDSALVALRAGQSDVDLLESASTLGRDGYAFPMAVRGVLLGVVVVIPKPSEHYTAEERKLLAMVVHEVGVALFAARARSQAEFLRELISDRALPEPLQTRARELIFAV